jgi:dihydroorotate dehydrogenase (NAD+) catalytic subunit
VTVDLAVTIGSVSLPNPVMTASGTAGHGAELARYVDLASLGAVVVKSLSQDPWPGNPSPRMHGAGVGMVNAVGLQGPGMSRWLAEDLPALRRTGARVVVSIWGRRVLDYERVATTLRGADGVVAVEVNVSCPNLEDRSHMFAHSATATAECVAAAKAARLPLWVKLSPTSAELPAIAAAAHDAGAEAVTLCNTSLGMAIDVETRRPVLANGGGGLSGPPVHAIAVRAVHDVHAAHPDLPIIGVGGISRGVDAVELALAGASAVQVGTATLAEPRATARILAEVERWCDDHGVPSFRSLTGGAHARRP